VRLKGIAEPQEVHRADWRSGSGDGRRDELDGTS
jgi:hypothetical protein